MTLAPIKAFLLAAGIGTRLRPLTEATPKILLPINGKPLLEIWLEHLRRHGIREVLINTHWQREKVEAFLEHRRNDNVRFVTYHEPSLLGNAGTLLANESWVAHGEPFFILYGDNLTNVDLTKMLEFHRHHGFPFTLGVFKTANPSQCGIANIGKNGIVTGFEEKPERPKSEMAAAGIYVADRRIFRFFPHEATHRSSRPLDLGFHVIPRLVGNMKAYPIDDFLMDIGTPESYEQAKELWKEVCGKRRFSDAYIDEMKKILDSFPHDEFERLIEGLLDAYLADKRIFVMGNGGSASTATHWACDINKGCSFNQEKRFKVICLNDNVATLMAYANDLSYQDIFVEQLKNFFVPGDVVIAISGSGNSANVLKAVQHANEHGGFTVGLCGFSGGRLHKIVDLPIHIPIHDMQKVEDLHMIIAHMTMQRIRQILTKDDHLSK